MAIDRKKVFKQSRLTYRLETLANQAISANDPLFVEKLGCNIREMRVLRLIDDYPGIEFNEIMYVSGLDRSLVSRLIRTLLDKGLVSRVNSTEDARRYGLFTTDMGKACRLVGRELSDTAETLLLQPLKPAEVEQLKEMLGKLLIWVRSDEYQTGVQALYGSFAGLEDREPSL